MPDRERKPGKQMLSQNPLSRGNLLDSTQSGSNSGESFTTLLQRDGVRIERIVSNGHTSPDGFWYDQSENEYVLLVHGGAELEIEGAGSVRLVAGDWLDIPAHVRHRVTFTELDTVWLAVFY